MAFFLEIGGFAIKILIVSAALGFLAIMVTGLFRRKFPEGQLNLVHLNLHYQEMKSQLQRAILDKKVFKAIQKEKPPEKKKRNVFVIDFHGDIAATTVCDLREQVTAVLTVAGPEDEVVVVLESGGGIFHNYGLAASQLTRLREKDIPLTVCVDKIAASGGYLMACVANRILAAPFAILGSIGVVVMFPNFHRLLKKYDVDYMELTAGEFKRTISHMGEITEKGKEKFLEELASSHELVKNFITENRPQVDMAKVATGEHWHGVEALELALADELRTSDDYLLTLSEEAEIYRLEFEASKTVKEKFAGIFAEAGDRLLLKWWDRFAKDTRFRS